MTVDIEFFLAWLVFLLHLSGLASKRSASCLSTLYGAASINPFLPSKALVSSLPALPLGIFHSRDRHCFFTGFKATLAYLHRVPASVYVLLTRLFLSAFWALAIFI